MYVSIRRMDPPHRRAFLKGHNWIQSIKLSVNGKDKYD